MDTITFLRQGTGASGYYCVLSLGDGRRTQKFYKDPEAAIHAAHNFDDNGRNAYFALGRFASAESREAANVQSMGALYLDLDCGPTKEYPDQATALKALRKFVRFVQLPKPIVVDSGRGLHVYWPLQDSVPLATWLPVAAKLKAACAALRFPCDTTATTDAARVLRMPETHNYKDNPPRPVSIILPGDAATPLAVFDGLISPHAPATAAIPAGLFEDAVGPGASRASVNKAGSAMMDALAGNIESSFKKIVRRSAAGTGCAQIAAMLTAPADVSEPLWRAGLSVATRCKEPKAVHWLSQGHPSYDPEDTEDKAARTKGPYTCVRFDELNPGLCAGCPHWSKIKSPIVLGHELAAAEEGAVTEPVQREVDAPATYPNGIPIYPKPYHRGRDGGVYLKTRNEDGEEELQMVWNNDIYVVRRLTDPELGEVVQMRHHLPRDGVRNFVVPLYVVTSKEEFRKALAAQGVAAINKEVDILMAYTQTWVKELQYTTVADNAHRQFGWVGDFSAFVLGEQVIYADRIEYNAPSAGTRGLVEHFAPKGTLDGWKAAMNFYNRPGFELHQFVVCAGFGSVLMKFMPINAALIHLWSKDSGFGKTTVQHASLSAWGNPGKLILGERDTYNSKMNRADVMHSLPVCMDEITNIRPADGSDLIYQVTGGQQRNRMQANGNTERYRGDPWNLLFVSSANCSLIDKVAMAKAMPKAEAQRVLEIEVSRLFTQKEDKEKTDAFSSSLHDHYGHAGPIFVQYVLQNLEQVDTLISTVQRQIDRGAKLGPENRFWSAAAATSIAAAVICNHLGLLSFNVKNLRDYVVHNVLQANQSASAAMHSDPMALVTEYVYQNWGRILQIKSTVDLRGKNHNGLDTLIVPEQLPKSTDLIARYETDIRRMLLMVKPFREWLAEQQINFNSVAEELKERHGAKRIRSRLTKGTAMNLPPTDVLELSMSIEGPDDGETAP